MHVYIHFKSIITHNHSLFTVSILTIIYKIFRDAPLE